MFSYLNSTFMQSSSTWIISKTRPHLIHFLEKRCLHNYILHLVGNFNQYSQRKKDFRVAFDSHPTVFLSSLTATEWRSHVTQKLRRSHMTYRWPAGIWQVVCASPGLCWGTDLPRQCEWPQLRHVWTRLAHDGQLRHMWLVCWPQLKLANYLERSLWFLGIVVAHPLAR